MCEGVDAKCQMVADDEPQDSGEQQHAEDVAERPAEQQRHPEIHSDGERQIMAMLKSHERVVLQLTDVN